MIRLRKAEEAALTDILTADHDSTTAACRAVLHTTTALLAARPAYVCVVGVEPGLKLPYGPWWDPRDAQRAAAYVAAYPVEIQRLLPAERCSDHLRLTDPDPHRCPTCAHPDFAHWPTKGCVVQLRTPEATLSTCRCTG